MKGSSFTGPIRDVSPCLDCRKPKRYHGCHDTCPDHAKWTAEKERVNANRRKYEYEKGIGIRKIK